MPAPLLGTRGNAHMSMQQLIVCGIAQVICVLHIVKLGVHSIVFKMTEACLGTLARGGTLAWPCDHAAASHDIIFHFGSHGVAHCVWNCIGYICLAHC